PHHAPGSAGLRHTLAGQSGHQAVCSALRPHCLAHRHCQGPRAWHCARGWQRPACSDVPVVQGGPKEHA
ncbi:unnamed protein product, partial [Closterium sp. NIES-54]